jgi:hypothetical protein
VNTKGTWDAVVKGFDDLTKIFKPDDSAAGNADSAYSAAMEGSRFEAVTAMNKDNGFFDGALLNKVSDWLPGLPGDTSCFGTLDIVINSHWGHVDFHRSPCSQLSDFRALLYWFFYVMTALTVIKIVFRETGAS